MEEGGRVAPGQDLPTKEADQVRQAVIRARRSAGGSAGSRGLVAWDMAGLLTREADQSPS